MTDSRPILNIFMIYPPLPSTATAMASVKRQRLGEGPAVGGGGWQSRGRWFSLSLFTSSSSFYSLCVFLAIKTNICLTITVERIEGKKEGKRMCCRQKAPKERCPETLSQNDEWKFGEEQRSSLLLQTLAAEQRGQFLLLFWENTQEQQDPREHICKLPI